MEEDHDSEASKEDLQGLVPASWEANVDKDPALLYDS
jgi:hypothetical protein